MQQEVFALLDVDRLGDVHRLGHVDVGRVVALEDPEVLPETHVVAGRLDLCLIERVDQRRLVHLLHRRPFATRDRRRDALRDELMVLAELDDFVVGQDHVSARTPRT
jgi:hypothetical protein